MGRQRRDRPGIVPSGHWLVVPHFGLSICPGSHLYPAPQLRFLLNGMRLPAQQASCSIAGSGPLKSFARFIMLIVSLALLQSCATSGTLSVAREQFMHGSASDALQTLSEADVSRRDRLLLYLDRGLVAQASGHYEGSIVALDGAAKLIDELDYVSIRDQSASIVSSDWAARYSGEYSERLWIHTFQMLNYLMLDTPQQAAVEARRAIALYDQWNNVLKQDVFTRELMAMSFRAAGQRDSAQVEYRKLARDFNHATAEPLADGDAELILFIATGFIERKLQGDLFIDLDARISFPYYPESTTNPPAIQLLSGGRPMALHRVDTDLVAVSRAALAERARAITTRQTLRLAAKYNIARAIEEQDELAGEITRLVLFAIEQADTRSWETLPAYLSMVRVAIPAGTHSLTLRVEDLDIRSSLVRQTRRLDLDLSPGEQHFQLLRLGIDPG